MSIRTVQDLLKTQQELLGRMRKQTEAAAKGGRPALSVVREEKQRELAHLRERLADTEKARDETRARYDGQIARQGEAIAGLEKDLAEMDEYEAADKAPPREGTKPAKGGPTTRRKK